MKQYQTAAKLMLICYNTVGLLLRQALICQRRHAACIYLHLPEWAYVIVARGLLDGQACSSGMALLNILGVSISCLVPALSSVLPCLQYPGREQ